PPPERLEECLRNIQELAWQLEQEIELQRASRSLAPRGLQPGPGAVKPESRNIVAPALPPIPAWPGWKRRAASDEPVPKVQSDGAVATEVLESAKASAPASPRIASFDEAPPPAEGWMSATEPEQPAAPVESAAAQAWVTAAAEEPPSETLAPESVTGREFAARAELVVGPDLAAAPTSAFATESSPDEASVEALAKVEPE